MPAKQKHGSCLCPCHDASIRLVTRRECPPFFESLWNAPFALAFPGTHMAGRKLMFGPGGETGYLPQLSSRP